MTGKAQQAIKEQMIARVTAESKKTIIAKTRNTQTQAKQMAIAESKKRQSWFCSHPLYQRNTISIFSTNMFVGLLFCPVLAEMQY